MKKIPKNILILNNNIETFSILSENISRLQKKIKRKENLTNEIKEKIKKLNGYFLKYQDNIGSEDSEYLIPLIFFLNKEIADDLKGYRKI